MTLWHWLVAQGFEKDVIAAAVAVAVGHVFAWRPYQKHRKAQDEITRTQAKIADRLDTSTPGGLADLIKITERSGGTGKGGR